MLGLVFFQAPFAVAVYAIVHRIVIRASGIRDLSDGEFVVLPIAAARCRLLGECLAWFFCALGVGGFLLILMAGPYASMATNQMPFTGMMSSGAGLAGAIFYLTFGLVSGFAVLMVFYLIAECTSLLSTIARNTEVVRKAAERSQVTFSGWCERRTSALLERRSRGRSRVSVTEDIMFNVLPRVTCIVSLLIISTFGAPSGASAAERDLPILFVHGWCSSSDTWNTMIERLQAAEPDRYGRRVVRMYVAGAAVLELDDARQPTGRGLRLTTDPNLEYVKTFTIDFFNSRMSSFNDIDVGEIDIQFKAGEMKKAIDKVKELTGFDKVIVVAHSLGGLVVRTYIANGAYIDGNAALPLNFDTDIARAITVDTPHFGASVGFQDSWFPYLDAALQLAPQRIVQSLPRFLACTSQPTLNRRQLAESSPFLDRLNSVHPIPSEVDVTSISSFQFTVFGIDDGTGDGIVSRSSQNLRSLQQFRTENITNEDNGFGADLFSRRTYLPLLHTEVLHESQTIALVRGLVRAAQNRYITGCESQSPGPSWVCVNRGWLPPGHPSIPGESGAAPTPPAAPAPAASPRIRALSPGVPTSSTVDLPVMVIGEGFQDGLSVQVGSPGGGASVLSGTQVHSVTPTSFVALATLNGAGSWTFRVINPNGRQSDAFGFTVQAPSASAPAPPATRCPTQSPGAGWVCVNDGWLPPGHPGIPIVITPAPTRPSISALSPTIPTSSTIDRPLTVIGQGFEPGLTVQVGFPGGGSSVLSGEQIHSVTPTSFVALATLNAAGTWTLRVTNPDGRQSGVFGFTVQAPSASSPAPPATRCPTQSPGAGWVCVNDGWLPPGHPGIPIVITPAPTRPSISALSPTIPTPSTIDRPLTVIGQGFEPGLTVQVGFPGGGSSVLSGRQIHSVTPTSFVALTTLNGPGTWTLRVTNPDGRQSDAFGFIVQAPSAPAPTPPPSACTTQSPGPNWVCVNNGWLPPGHPGIPVASTPAPIRPSISALSPTIPTSSTIDRPVTVIGQGFEPGLTVQVGFPGGGSSVLSGTQIHSVTPTSFVALVTLNGAGTWTFRVTNPDGRQSDVLGFTVQAPSAPAPPPPTSACPTQSPGAGWVCVDGGWLPPGHPRIPVAADFAISASPAKRTVTRGGATSYMVTVQSLNGFSGAVQLFALNLPGDRVLPGTAWNPVSVMVPANGTATSTFTLITDAQTPTGTFTLTFEGRSGGVNRSTTGSVTVNPAAAAPDFAVSVAPGSRTLARGGSTSYTVSVQGLNGFSGAVQFFALNLPGDRVLPGTAWNPTSVTVPANGTATSTFTLVTDAQTPTGTFTIAFQGRNGSVIRSASGTVDVVAASIDPVVTSISPTTPAATGMGNQVVGVFGNEFQQNLTVTITWPGGASTLSGAQIQSVTPTSFQMLIDFGAGGGTWSARVNNPDGRRSNTFPFTVGTALPPTLRLDGATSSTRQIGQTFSYTGSGYRPGQSVTRHVSPPINGSSVLMPAMRADSAGDLAWTFSPTCGNPIGTFTIHVVDDVTGRASNPVTLTVLASSDCG